MARQADAIIEQARDAGLPMKHLIRDRDGMYVRDFDDILERAGRQRRADGPARAESKCLHRTLDQVDSGRVPQPFYRLWTTAFRPSRVVLPEFLQLATSSSKPRQPAAQRRWSTIRSWPTKRSFAANRLAACCGTISASPPELLRPFYLRPNLLTGRQPPLRRRHAPRRRAVALFIVGSHLATSRRSQSSRQHVAATHFRHDATFCTVRSFATTSALNRRVPANTPLLPNQLAPNKPAMPRQRRQARKHSPNNHCQGSQALSDKCT
jgi:hypothetical protein